MAMSGGKDDGAPMIEMNMTPLIDVLLVLLIMFIITIPVATHAVNIDLPQPNPNPPPEDQIDPIKNKIVLTQTDEILWNGDTLNEAELVRNLNLTRDIVPEPELQFEPEALASYELSAPQRHQGERRHQVRLRRKRALPHVRQHDRTVSGHTKTSREGGFGRPFCCPPEMLREASCAPTKARGARLMCTAPSTPAVSRHRVEKIGLNR